MYCVTFCNQGYAVSVTITHINQLLEYIYVWYLCYETIYNLKSTRLFAGQVSQKYSVLSPVGYYYNSQSFVTLSQQCSKTDILAKTLRSIFVQQIGNNFVTSRMSDRTMCIKFCVRKSINFTIIHTFYYVTNTIFLTKLKCILLQAIAHLVSHTIKPLSITPILDNQAISLVRMQTNRATLL